MNKKIIFGVSIFLASALIFVLVFAFNVTGNATKNCFDIEGKIVKGQSLSPIINDSQYINLYYDYYDCNPVEREDIIAYNLSIAPNPLIKIVKGIPRDNLSFEDVGNGRWYILVNGEVLRTSENLSYQLNTQNYFALKEYAGSVIPKNHYLILGNRIAGSVDSRDFGLIEKSNIIGAVGLYDNSSVVINDYVDALGRYSQYYINFSGSAVPPCLTGWTSVNSGRNCSLNFTNNGLTPAGGVKCVEPGSNLCAMYYSSQLKDREGGGLITIIWAGSGSEYNCNSTAGWAMCAQ